MKTKSVGHYLFVFLMLSFFGKAVANDELEAIIQKEASSGSLNLQRFRELETKYFADKKTFEYEPHVSNHPFVPSPWDYGFEVGNMFYEENLAWLGMNMGWHLGLCMFSDSQTCQQYIDFLGGVGASSNETRYIGALSLRWQFVNFPKAWSPLARIFVGDMHSLVPEGTRDDLVYGVGYGVSTFLHKRADLRMEARLGVVDEKVYSQVFVAIELKIDRWLEFFADKIQELGLGTIRTGGEIIQGTVEATGTGIKKTGEILISPFESNKDKKKTEDKKSDIPAEQKVEKSEEKNN